MRFFGVSSGCARNLGTVVECMSLPAAFAWKDCSLVWWVPREVCAAWLYSSREQEDCCWVRCVDVPLKEPRSHLAAAVEAGLCPVSCGCCNDVDCLWHLVGRVTGFVILL